MKHITKLFILLIFTLTTVNSSAASKEVRTKHYNLKDGLALKGYDPVSYIDHNKAVKGKSIYVHTQEGVKYRFSSRANLTKFKASPSKYEPQYGGWCAYALSDGNGKVDINPKRFKVIKGKLYLYYDAFPWGNTLEKWNEGNDAAQIKKANSAWKKLLP